MGAEKLLGLLRSMDISLAEALHPAKYRTPQTFLSHSLNVAVASRDICRAVSEWASEEYRWIIEDLERKFKLELGDICFAAGFLHDWNKIFVEGIGQNPSAQRERALELARSLLNTMRPGQRASDTEVELLLSIARSAESSTPGHRELVVTAAVRLADAMFVSDIETPADVLSLIERDERYRSALEHLRAVANLDMGYVVFRQRLILSVISKKVVELLENRGFIPIAIYASGVLVIFNRATAKPIDIDWLVEELGKGIEALIREETAASLPSDLRRCIENIAEGVEEYLELRSEGQPKRSSGEDKVAALLLERPEKAIVNAVFPPRICRMLSDYRYLVENRGALEEAIKNYIEESGRLSIARAAALTAYIVCRASKSDEDRRELAKRVLGREVGGFPDCLYSAVDYITERREEIVKDPGAFVRAIADAVTQVLSVPPTSAIYLSRYAVQGSDSVLIQKGTKVKGAKAIFYCSVCGEPILSEEEFQQQRLRTYADSLEGKVEYWHPHEPALERLDDHVGNRAVCRLCTAESQIYRRWLAPPILAVHFIPGTAYGLADLWYRLYYRALSTVITRKDSELITKIAEASRVLEGGKLGEFLDILGVDSEETTEESGGTETIFFDYTGAKIIMPASRLAGGVSTRVDRQALEEVLVRVPLIAMIGGGPISIGWGTTHLAYPRPREATIRITAPVRVSWLDLEQKETRTRILLSYSLKALISRLVKKGDTGAAEVDMAMERAASLPGLGMSRKAVVVAGIPEVPVKAINLVSGALGALSRILSEVERLEAGQTGTKAEQETEAMSLSRAIANYIKVAREKLRQERGVSKHRIVGPIREAGDRFFSLWPYRKPGSRDEIYIAVNAGIGHAERNWGSLSDEERGALFASIKAIIGYVEEIARSSPTLAREVLNDIATWAYNMYIYERGQAKREADTEEVETPAQA